MPKSFTIAAASGAYGFLIGILLPGSIAYSVLFLRRNGRHLKTVVRLCGRLFLGLLIAAGFGMAMMLLITLAGGTEDMLVDSPSYVTGAFIGLGISVVALFIGSYRSRRHHATAPR